MKLTEIYILFNDSIAKGTNYNIICITNDREPNFTHYIQKETFQYSFTKPICAMKDILKGGLHKRYKDIPNISLRECDIDTMTGEYYPTISSHCVSIWSLRLRGKEKKSLV